MRLWFVFRAFFVLIPLRAPQMFLFFFFFAKFQHSACLIHTNIYEFVFVDYIFPFIIIYDSCSHLFFLFPPKFTIDCLNTSTSVQRASAEWELRIRNIIIKVKKKQRIIFTRDSGIKYLKAWGRGNWNAAPEWVMSSLAINFFFCPTVLLRYYFLPGFSKYLEIIIMIFSRGQQSCQFHIPLSVLNY